MNTSQSRFKLFGAEVILFVVFTLVVLFLSRPATNNFEEIGYGFTDYYQSLRDHGTYEARLDQPTVYKSIVTVHAERLPMVPIVMALFSFVSTNLYLLYAVKGLIVIAFIVAGCLNISRACNMNSKQRIALFGLMAINIFVFKQSIAVTPEEPYFTAPLFFAFSLMMLKPSWQKGLVVGLCLAFAYLCKSSVIIFELAMLTMYAARCVGNKNFRIVLVAALPLTVAVLSWAFYAKSTTGRFAILANSSSVNGINLYKGNNVWFLDHYPYGNVDDIDAEGKTAPKNLVSDEWEHHDTMVRYAMEFKQNHPDLWRKGLVEKLKMAFLKFDGAQSNQTAEYSRKKAIPFVVNRLLSWICAGMWLASVLTCIIKKRRPSVNIVMFPIIFIAAISPYLIGFLFHRHMVPIYILTTAMIVPFYIELKARTSDSEGSTLQTP
jgi:hypothetical protein